MSRKWSEFMQQGQYSFDQEEFNDAVHFFEAAVEEAKKIFGTNHPNYAQSLNSLGSAYTFMGEYKKAENVLCQARNVTKKIFGKENLYYPITLNNLSFLYQSIEDYQKAERLCRQALSIREHVLGKQHPHYITNLGHLAILYNSMGEYIKAVPLFHQILDILENTSGKESPQYIAHLDELALVYETMGEDDKAEPLYQQLLNIKERVVGKDHPEYAECLDNLVRLHNKIQLKSSQSPMAGSSSFVLYEELPQDVVELYILAESHISKGEYQAAEPLLRRFLELQTNIKSQDRPEYASYLTRLAWVYKQMGKYEHAEPLLEQALHIAKRTSGEKNPHYLLALNNLAVNYKSLEKYDKSEPLYRQALEIMKDVLGEKHPDYAGILYNLGMLYVAKKHYEKAEPHLRQAMDIRKEVLGTEHFDYALSLNGLAEVYIATEDYDKAEPLLYQALAIQESKLGKKHYEYDQCLNNLAFLYEKKEEYKQAEELYRQSLEIREEVLGQEHPAYAKGLDNLAMVYYDIKEYDKAESVLKQALSIRERIVPPENTGYMANLYNLTLIYKSIEDYEKAIPLCEKLLNIKEKVLGKEHPQYVDTLYQLAKIYFAIKEADKAAALFQEALDLSEKSLGLDYPLVQALSAKSLITSKWAVGEHHEAELLFQEAVETTQKNLGIEHPKHLLNLHRLSILYRLQGDYDKAEPLILQCLEVAERILGKRTAFYVVSLNSLAGLYKEMKEYDKAEPLFRQALELREEIYGLEHPAYATGLNNLASLYLSMRSYEKAEPLFRHALKIREKTSQKEHPDYAQCLMNLANLYTEKGEHEKAEPLLYQALEIQESVVGKKHPDYALSLHNLGRLYYSIGKYDKAETLLCQSVDIQKSILGKNHPDYASNLNFLGWLQVVVGKPKQALEKMLEAANIYVQMIIKMSSISDEKRLQNYIRTFQMMYFGILSNFSRHYSELQEYTSLVFNVILKFKAVSLEISAIQRDYILKNKNPRFKGTFDELRKARRQVSALIHEALHVNLTRQDQQKIHTLEQRIKNLEKRLAAEIPQEELRQKLGCVDYKTVVKLIPGDTILIEFVRFRQVDFIKKETAGIGWEKGSCYLAFVLSNDLKKNIQVIDFYDLEIDFLIGLYRSVIAGPPIQEKKNSHQEQYDGTLLYKKLFQPIIDMIGGTKKLIISPDGNLVLLPFEVLPQKNGRYVIEDFEISYIDVSRDLLRFQYHDEPQSASLILADPDFDLAGYGKVSAMASYKSKQKKNERSIMATKVQYNFPRLEGTKHEGEIVEKLLGGNTELWTGEKVLDRKVKQVQAPQILHIATHGYYIPYQDEYEQEFLNKFASSMGLKEQGMDLIIKEMSMNLLSELGIKRTENPLLCSALALAGANTFLKGKTLPEEAEDGLLTALDVTGMDLIGTDLVALSACKTGLGEVKSGEGVYGLRRAFTLAGARTLIVSLWNVPDEETKELMVKFYTKILENMDKATALREAQLELLKNRRKAGKSDSPFYWGAFVCVGYPGSPNSTPKKWGKRSTSFMSKVFRLLKR